jgi:hypothetical protein
MSYTRPPASTLAGRALKQTPAPSTQALAPVLLDAEIAATTHLGVVQVGSGLSITPTGVLSATNSSDLFAVKIVTANYTATANDYYIGAIKKEITVTLPKGVTGKVYVVKNQENGEITVTGTAGQKIDGFSSQKLSTNKSLMLIFDGTEWQSIATNSSDTLLSL